MMIWNYAEMVHNAKLNGGPEQYVSTIHNKGFQDGIRQGRIDSVAMMLGVATGSLIAKLIIGRDRAKKITERENEEAKEALINKYWNRIVYEGVSSVDDDSPIIIEAIEIEKDDINDEDYMEE